MKRVAYAVLLVADFLVAGVSSGQAAIGEEAVHEEIVAFDDARQIWLESTSCYGRFDFRQSICYSLEEALEVEIPEKNVVAKGVLAKMGEKVRFIVRYNGAPIEHGHGRVQNRSSDDIFDDRYWIHSGPEQGDDFGFSGSLNYVPAERYRACLQISSLCSPLSLSLDPVTHLPASLEISSTPRVARIDAGQMRIELESKPKVGLILTKTVDFRVDTELPSIEMIEFRNLNSESREVVDRTIQQVMAWSDVSGLAVPSCVGRISGPLKPVGGTRRDNWIVSEWTSTDLGLRAPTSQDFVLKLPDGVTRLTGMKYEAVDGIVDIDTITEDDFLSSGSLDRSVGVSRWQSNSALRSLLLCATIVGVAIMIFVWVRGQRARD